MDQIKWRPSCVESVRTIFFFSEHALFSSQHLFFYVRYSGVNCEKFVCDSSPCLNGATCSSNTQGGVTCTCTDGYSGHLCDNDACDPNLCQNNGTCTRQPGAGFSCQCEPGMNGYSVNQLTSWSTTDLYQCCCVLP